MRTTVDGFGRQVSAGWVIDASTKAKYDVKFAQLELTSDAKVGSIAHSSVSRCSLLIFDGRWQLSGANARTVLLGSGVDKKELRQIWTLADCDADGFLVRYTLHDACRFYPIPHVVSQLVVIGVDRIRTSLRWRST